MQKTLKRIITIILLLCVALSFACFTACNVENSPETPTNPSQQEQTENTDLNNSDNLQNNGATKHTCSFVLEKAEEKYLNSAATCTEKTVYYKSCSCGEKGTETFEYGEAKGHSYTNYLSDNNATCVDNATETATCENGCGTSDTRAIENSALGHDLQKSETVNYCTIRKSKKYKCSRCTKETEEFTNAHIMGDNLPDAHKSLSVGGTCEYCGGEVLAKNGDSLVIKSGNIYQVEHYFGTAVCFSDYASLINSAYISNKVTTIGSKAFKDYTALTSVTIPNRVTRIEQYAFDDCSSLTSVYYIGSINDWVQINFADSSSSPLIYASCFYIGNVLVTEANITAANIKNYAFYGYKSLTSVTIGKGVKSIGYLSFSSCNKLVEVINKSKLTITKGSSGNGCIGEYVLNIKTEGVSEIVNKDGYLFYTYDKVNYLLGYVGNETSLTLPEKYNGQNYEIYKFAIYRSRSLTSVTILNSVTSIGNGAFAFCSSLVSITIPDTITSIGEAAFWNCPKLVEVINKSKLTITKGSSGNGYIGYYALNVKKEGESDIVKTEDGYLFYTYGSVNYLLGYEGNETSLTLPENYKGQNYEIYKCAFSGCSSLVSVTIGSGVTCIGDYAFDNCTKLTSVTIPDSVTSIGYRAFCFCKSLKSVAIGNGVTSIGGQVFEYCSSLKSVMIGNGAFFNCSSLTSIEIPNSVTSIGNVAFYGCSSLTSVTFVNSNGWYMCEDSTATSGTKLTLTDTARNAMYLTSDYCSYYWKRG